MKVKFSLKEDMLEFKMYRVEGLSQTLCDYTIELLDEQTKEKREVKFFSSNDYKEFNSRKAAKCVLMSARTGKICYGWIKAF